MNINENLDNMDADVFDILNQEYFKKEDDFFEKNPPDFLYHYTNASGIQGVLKQNGMYASPYFTMNDPSEVIYGLEIIEETCKHLIANGTSQGILSICNAILNDQIIRNKTFYHTSIDLVLISFSEEKDNLSQWRAYSNDAKGYCIEIDSNTLKKIDKNDPLMTKIGPWSFYKCIYDKSLQMNLVEKWIILADSVLGKLNLPQNALSAHVLNGLINIIFTFKHNAYRDEKEWRVMTFAKSSEILPTYMSGEMIKASKLIPFGSRHVITGISCGPKQDFRTAKFGLIHFLKDPIVQSYQGQFSINITKSEAPYR